MPIKTARDEYVIEGRPYSGARAVIEKLRSFGKPIPEPSVGDPIGTPVVARVNWGRWIGDCNGLNPTNNEHCLSAQILDIDDKRFYCTECFNYANSGRWRPVTWPNNKAEIEQSLDTLPEAEQNWEIPKGKVGPDPNPPIYGPD